MVFRRAFAVSLLVCLCLSLEYQNDGFVFRGSQLDIEFGASKDGFPIVQLNKTTEPYHAFLLPHTDEYGPPSTLWSLELVGKEGLQHELNARSPATVSKEEENGTIVLKYVMHEFPVTVLATIESSEQGIEFRASVDVDPSGNVCLWNFVYPRIDGLGTKEQFMHQVYDSIFFPVGYGQIWNNVTKNRNVNFNTLYPAENVAMQYQAFIHNNESTFYFGVHDPNAYLKQIAIHADTYTNGNAKHAPHSSYWATHFPESACSAPTGGKLQYHYEMPYPVVLHAIDGSWYHAAQVYRDWVLPNAEWTRKGPVLYRNDTPDWFRHTTMWVNTNWYPGALNATLGDPAIAMRNILEAQKAFEVEEMMVHWYTWEQFPFDTNYPDYSAKNGFASSIEKLHEKAIRVVPYINGRLYDYNAPTFHSSNAIQWSAKNVAPRMNPRTVNPNIEVYGSGQFMCPQCPATEFWQTTIASVVKKIVSTYDTDGVYIDQIAAAWPYLCADPDHGHSTRGGDFWVKGYEKLLDLARAYTSNQRIMITEEMTESYMAGVNAFLTLSPYSQCNMVPAYMSVYGGYHISSGRTFTPRDLKNGASGFAMKMGQMFVYGAQMGWLALAGGVGIPDIYRNDSYADVLTYTRSLTRYRRHAAFNFLLDGRLMETLGDLGSTKYIGANGCEPYPAIQHGIWQTLDGERTAIILTNTYEKEQFLVLHADLRRYGYPSSGAYELKRWGPYGNSSSIVYKGSFPMLDYVYDLQGFDTMVLEILSNSTSHEQIV